MNKPTQQPAEQNRPLPTPQELKEAHELKMFLLANKRHNELHEKYNKK